MTDASAVPPLIHAPAEAISTRSPAPQAATPPWQPGPADALSAAPGKDGDRDQATAARGASPLPLSPVRQDLRESLSPTEALLRVIRVKHDGADCFRLQMSPSQQESRHEPDVADDPERFGRPDIVLPNGHAREERARVAVRCLDDMKMWSETKYELTSWLTGLRRQHDADLQLIVWDDTGYGIPWELFWHRMDGGSGWLGAIAEITRWTTVHVDDQERRTQFSGRQSSEPIHGGIIYHEELEEADRHGQPKDDYSIRDRQGHPSHEPETSLEELVEKLCERDSEDHYGLVYIRAHGTGGETAETVKIGSVTLAVMYRAELYRVQASKAWVFLNACNSADPVLIEGMNDGITRNFAAIFLREEATGVVATLGEVEIDYSAALARDLVKDAYENENGVRVSAYLRDRRREEARGLKNKIILTEEDEHKRLDFIYTCMFAYFGHPKSTFRLA
jgi:hypothetical protein